MATHHCAVFYRGHAHQGAKAFRSGTHRSIPPGETLERIRPHLRRFGITRLANITGLDWVGIPVTMAVRPNAHSLSNGSGKGVTLDAALASCAMEAMELSHAEEIELPTFEAPYGELPEPRIPLEDLPTTRHNLLREWWPLRWTMGWDIASEQEVPVPWWIIRMSQHPLRRRDLHSFQVTSNGLASGNTLLEAINAGLFEVIERDAVACNLLAQRQLGRTPPIVDPATVRAPLVLELIDRLRHAGAEMVLFDCTIDTAVPTYMANIRDRRLPALGVCVGYGAHLDTEVAMVRAITEAVQSRAVRIAGSRDDTFRHHFLALPAATAADRAPAARCAVTVDAGARRSEAGPTFEGDTQAVLRKLRSAGLRRAIVVDLSLPELPIRVVKVIVPGLEGSLHHFYEPGRRARAFLAKEAVA